MLDGQAEAMLAQAGSLNADYLSDLFDHVHCESLSIFIARYAAPWRLDFPGQAETCGYFIQEGGAVLEESGLRHELKAGDLALVLQGTPHRLYNGDDELPVCIGHCTQRLDRARAAPLLKLLPPALVLRGENGEIASWLKPMAVLIQNLRQAADAGSLAILRRISEAALIRMAQEYLQHQIPFGSNVLPADFHRIAPVLRVLHRRPGAPWSVASLAREVGMSRTVFAAVFTEAMGEAPGHYLTKLRMSTARELMNAGTLSVAEVAARVGYGTEIAFSRAFKRQYGASPSSFRKANVTV